MPRCCAKKLRSSVTGLLALIGNTEIDPLRSREHILLSNILEHAWSSGKSLSLMDLILQVQKPPFDRLGAFPLENFFPEKDRFELSMLLNNFLASPSFQTWLEGEPAGYRRNAVYAGWTAPPQRFLSGAPQRK